jgi:eukaryotic-like serine/threonine-protein kinase
MGDLTTRQLSQRRARQRETKDGQLQAGDILQDRYRIVGILGVGGFSSVYQARDMRFPNVTKLCAVKEMVNVAPDPQIRAIAARAFEREASILATLDHPAVVGVYDYFNETDRSYLVLEFIRGKDLESLLNEQQDFFPQDKVMDWALQICDVLSYLHGQKPDPIIFRDMKPSNVMLDPHGRVRLIDFGIAKVFQSEEKNTTIGTEGYAPPEQYRGEASPAGDVYGLGATMHHLLTRQDPRLEPPFSFHERPVHAANPQVAPALEKIIMRCLSYNAADRYPNAAALRDALMAVARPGGSDQSAAVTRRLGAVGEGGAAFGDREVTASLAGGAGDVTPLWVFKAEDEIRSTPAVAQGVVYVGVYDNNLYALDAKTGRFLWKHPASSGIASSPHVYGGAVFMGSADKHLYSINTANGRQNWRFQTGGPIYSSPRARFEHVFFGSDDAHLYAVNTTTGKPAWKTHAFDPIRSSPHISDDYVFFGTEGGYVFCVDLAGTIKWQFQARRAVTSTPTVAADMVFLGSVDSTVYALDLSSGWAVWRFRTNRAIISSPTVVDDVLYIGSADGSVYAIEINTGRKLWSYETEGQVASSPAVNSSGVYFGSADGYIYRLSTSGRLQWRYKTEGMVISSPIIEEGILYIGSTDHHLYALAL